MPNLHSLARKSLSNPAWFKSEVTRQGQLGDVSSQEFEQLLKLINQMDRMKEPPTPENYFQLLKSLQMRPQYTHPIQSQDEFPNFKCGGLVQWRNHLKRN